uniref:Cytochrome b5 heme-binding domain-containing protein n=1 Tax=Hyaloperonospora arabidopsidis (strain Emoy2) TaxID=559515 RepID=M4BQE5_HYAAE
MVKKSASVMTKEPLPSRTKNKPLLLTAEPYATFCPDLVLFPAVRSPLPVSDKTVASSFVSTTDTCYPKCMDTEKNELLIEASIQSPLAATTDTESALCQVEPEQTIDLEELGLDVASQTEQQRGESIIVDYEDSDGDRVELRDKASTCTPSACGPLTSSVAAADDWNSGRGARRRSRCSRSETVSMQKKCLLYQQEAVEVPEADAEEESRCSKVLKLCMCEVKLHRSLESCWLVSSGQVYDVTGLVIAHPGGVRSILRKAGGPDCARDMKFHTKSARKMMEKCFIGKLEQCGEDVDCAGDANCNVM